MPRLKSIATPIPNHVPMVACRQCGHQVAMPILWLLRQFGPEFPLEEAIWWMHCSRCGAKRRGEMRVVRLCDPGAECRGSEPNPTSAVYAGSGPYISQILDRDFEGRL